MNTDPSSPPPVEGTSQLSGVERRMLALLNRRGKRAFLIGKSAERPLLMLRRRRG